MSVEKRAINRRQVLKGSAVATAAGALGPFFPGRVLGANDRVNLAIIGTRGQGTAHLKYFPSIANVKVKTVCDVDENILGARLKEFETKFKYAPAPATDLRKVFEDKDIDAVTMAIPNFWHALASIWAAQAKKHVYVEKPACHTIWEGRQMVNAARKYGVLMQVGFQNRSRKSTMAAIKFLHDGKLGKVYMGRGLCFKPRVNIGRYPDGPQPDGSKPIASVPGDPKPGPYTKSYLDKVHYDLWMGPTPQKPFNPNRFHYNWHWQWDYGGGDTANQGPHQFDIGRWGLNKDEPPVKVRSFGNLYLYGDSQQETPNVQTSIFEYADGTIFEFGTRGLLTNPEGLLPLEGKSPSTGVKIGNIFYGSEGRLEIDADGNWATFLGPKGEPGPNSKGIEKEASNALDTVGSGLGGHMQNFIEAVVAHNQEKLTCDIEVGFKSSMLPLMANTSYRLKRELKWDAKKEQFADAEANKMLHRHDRKGFQVPKLG
jgi:predicted dehydrogenase